MGPILSKRTPRNIAKPADPKSYKSYVGDYGIVKTLGNGGSCKVKLAFTKDDDKAIALKIMNADDEQVLELMQ